MQVFEPIHSFATTFDVNYPNDDLLNGYSRLFYLDRLLPPKVVTGSLFRQYKVNDLFLIITLYDGFDYDSLRFMVLNEKFELLEQHVSPNFSGKKIRPHDQQFLSLSHDQLKFYLGAEDPWVIQALDQPKYLPGEAFSRMKSFWWPQFEVSKFFKRSHFSIRKIS